MNPAIFGIAFLLGTAAIALWFYTRFPSLAPSDLYRAMLRAGIALAATWLLFPPLWAAAVASGPVLLALFVVAFPCLTYLLLSTIWAIEKLQAAMRGAR